MDPGAQTGKQSSTIVDTTTQAASQRLYLLHAKYIHANLHCTYHPLGTHPPIHLHLPFPCTLPPPTPTPSLPQHYLISHEKINNKTCQQTWRGEGREGEGREGEGRGAVGGDGERSLRAHQKIHKCPQKEITCTDQLVH